MRRTVLLAGMMVSCLGAGVTIPSKAKDTAVTVYNNNLAFVHEKREVQVQKGLQTLIYEGVASQVITASVVPQFYGAGVRLYSQNFRYNLISLDSLIQNSIGQKVTFYTNGENPKLQKGTLLCAAPVVVKSDQDGKLYSLDSPTQVVFSGIPPSMITRPSLVWRAEIDKNAKLGIDLKYLSRAINWKSDYVLDLKPKTLDLHGWITINNNSGVTYENAQIRCIAGELHEAVLPVHYRNFDAKAAMPVTEAVHEESFSGYHLYKIPFRETLRDKEQKQILFIDKKGISYIQYGKAVNSYFENYGVQKLSFANIVTFTNTKSNHAGIPLPAGTVRMYSKDSGGETHYVGEDRLANTPEEERVKLTVGTLFDVVGEKRITRFVADRYHRDVETTYEVRNRGKEPIEVKIEERIPAYGTKITTKSSCKGACKEEKKSAFVREFTIALKPKGSYKFTTEFEVVY
ncbi:MAG: hypothetical protein DSZ05_03785 [Sulfurospirillum sp.]|nr:MAG: hypothetical protein DSZ05_03785 [Sulfurospirillum sp.]